MEWCMYCGRRTSRGLIRRARSFFGLAPEVRPEICRPCAKHLLKPLAGPPPPAKPFREGPMVPFPGWAEPHLIDPARIDFEHAFGRGGGVSER